MSDYDRKANEYRFSIDDRFSSILMYQENGDYAVYVHDKDAPVGERIQHPEHMAHVANELTERIAELEAEVRQLTDELYEREIAKAISTRRAEAIHE